MKIDYSPLNEEQVNTLQSVMFKCKLLMSTILGEIQECPGLLEKGIKIELSFDPKWKTIGQQIQVKRDVIDNDEIRSEGYYITRGIGEKDEGWELDTTLCTKGFAELLKNDGYKELLY